MREHFDFYGYNGPHSGKYYMDKVETYTAIFIEIEG